MSPTDASAMGSPVPISAGSPFNDELFFEPEKTNSVTDPSVANPFLPESSQGEMANPNPFLPDSSQGEMANPFLQNSSHGDGTGAEVRSTDANNDVVPVPVLEVPEDKEAEIGEFVARLVANLIMTAVIAVSNELDKAFNDEVSNDGDKLMSTANLTVEPSSLLLTATEEMSPAQAVLDGEEPEEDHYDGLHLARRSLLLASGMDPAATKTDVSGLDLESYDEEFEAQSP
jgi:hypothetical protein